MRKRYETVIYDLDGTLLNTLEDLANAVNHAMRESGYPERTSEEVCRFVGNGVGQLDPSCAAGVRRRRRGSLRGNPAGV